MQVSAIGPNFKGQYDKIDQAMLIDDEILRRIAYNRAISSTNQKKHNRVTKGLILSAPIAAGVVAALLSKGNSKIFSKEVSGVAARAAAGLKTGFFWAAGLGAVGVVGALKSLLNKHFEGARKFDAEHPFLSMALLIGAGFGAMSLTGRGIQKLASKEAPKFLQSFTEKAAKFINNNKMTTVMKSGYKSLLAKTPDALKDIGKTALWWAPETLLLGALFNSIGHGNAVQRKAAKNYNELKHEQLKSLVVDRARLQVENDFLKLDAQNKENVNLINDPLVDLPEEIIEKVAQIR